MKRVWLFAVLAFAFALPITAQENERVTVADNVMKDVVKRILTWYFKPRTRPTTIYVASDYVKHEWLPDIKNIQFILEPEQPDRLHYLFGPVERRGSRFDINFGRFRGCTKLDGGGGCCHTTGDTWSFRSSQGRTRLRRTAIGWAGDGCGWP